MSEHLAPGTAVSARRRDPSHHTRVPRYIRGARGTIVEFQGAHPLPDDRSRGLAAEPQPVYTVRFAARELFGSGSHWVHVDLWQDYLQPDTEQTDRDER
jgi:nitrile hydratase subunit beta